MHTPSLVTVVAVASLIAGCGTQTGTPGSSPSSSGASPSATPSSPVASPARTASTGAGQPDPPSTPTPARLRASASGPYGWLDADTPFDTYAVAFVRGLDAAAVLRTLGDVGEDVGLMTAAEAEELSIDLTSPRTNDGPSVVQVDTLPGGVVAYAPSAFEPFDRVRRLSRAGAAAAFVTTVELDTFVRVARDGDLVRGFDPFFHRARSPRSLPEERGLRWRGNRFFASSWQVLGRVTGIEVRRSWLLDRPHPTYVLAD